MRNINQKARFILALLAGIFLFFCFANGANQPDFPKIYVDEGCGGTHVGSQANPYDDLSDINWTTGGDNSIFDYLAGSPTESPTIYLKKGDEWREQMTIGCSGTATYPIIITSYGSGGNAVINGASLIGTWTEYGTWVADWNPVLDQNSDGSDTRNRRQVYSCTTSGIKIRVTYTASTGSDAGIDGTSIGPRSGSTDDFASAPTRITWDSGNNTTTITAGTSKLSDEITFSVTNGNDYLIHTYYEGTYSYKLALVGGSLYFQNSSVSDDTMIQAVSYSSASQIQSIDLVEVFAGQANTWKATCTTEPNQVFFDGTRGTKESSIANLNSANEWYWEANVLYVYSTSDPDSAYTNPGIEAGKRDFCIDTNSQDYIIAQCLKFKHGNSANVLLDGTNQTDLNYCISVDGIDGVEMDTAGSKVQNCVIYDCTNGIDVDAAGHVKNTIIRNCTDDLEESGASINKTTNSIEDDGASDPLFVNSTSGDFKLQSTSPCIDAGTDVGLSEDYEGTFVPQGAGVDIGAFEYSSLGVFCIDVSGRIIIVNEGEILRAIGKMLIMKDGQVLIRIK